MTTREYEKQLAKQASKYVDQQRSEDDWNNAITLVDEFREYVRVNEIRRPKDLPERFQPILRA